MARFLATVSEPAILEAAEHELKEGNERFAAALRAWWRPHAHYGSLRALTAPQSLALWLGPAQEWVRAWLLGAFAEPPSKAETEDARRRGLAVPARERRLISPGLGDLPEAERSAQ